MLSQMGGDALGLKNPADLYLYIGMLKSRTVADRIIDKFNLMKVYDTKYREDARKILLKNLKATADTKSGIITIGVEDKDPVRSSQMANAFVEELKNLVRGLATTEASQRRLFFEEQFNPTSSTFE
ncbi:hypothetical protein JCM13991_13180 [Thermodesulfovibrio hydrogeniphilus]